MANVTVIYRNILENSTVTSTDANTLFPLYRTYDRDIGKLFKFNTHIANLYVAIDQGAVTSYEIDRLIIPVGHTLNGLDCKLQYSTSEFPITAVTIGNGGTDYEVNDILTLVQAGAAGGTVTVTEVAVGVITAIALTTGGTNYRVENGLATTGHTGDASINVTTVDATDALSWTQSDALIINKSFTVQAKRYWRLLITSDPDAAPELPELFLGADYIFQEDVSIDLVAGYKRNVTRIETKAGKVRTVKLGEPKKHKIYKLNVISTATQMADFQLWEDHCGGYKPMWIIDHDGTLVYMEMLNELEFTYVSPSLVNTVLDLLEVL